MMKLREVRAIYRLLEEVRTLGADPLRWPCHALRGLCELLEAKCAACCVMTLPSPGKPPEHEVFHVVGLDKREEVETLFDFNRSADAFSNDPYSSRRFAKPLPVFSSKIRQEVVSDEDFYRHPNTASRYLALGVDQICDSVFISPSIGKMFGIIVLSPVGAPAFKPQHKKILRLFHIEMARMWKNDLTIPDDLQIRDLAPRLREVLWMLCMGESEKEIAGKLKLSPHTVHDYIKTLYKNFEVKSRVALLSKVLRRPRPGLDAIKPPNDGYFAELNPTDPPTAVPRQP